MVRDNLTGASRCSVAFDGFDKLTRRLTSASVRLSSRRSLSRAIELVETQAPCGERPSAPEPAEGVEPQSNARRHGTCRTQRA